MTGRFVSAGVGIVVAAIVVALLREQAVSDVPNNHDDGTDTSVAEPLVHADILRRHMGTKFPYPVPRSTQKGFVYNSSPSPDGCHLVQVNHVGRHGSRHLTKLKKALRAIDTLEADPASLTPRGRQLVSWLREFVETEQHNLGDLTEDGRAELRGQGKRLFRWLRKELLPGPGQPPRTMLFESTFKLRAQHSRDEFITGARDALGSAIDQVDIRVSEPPHCPPGEEPPHELHVLRFFDSCKAYKDYSSSKKYKADAARLMEGLDPEAHILCREEFIKSLVTGASQNGKPMDAATMDHLTEDLYGACQIQFGAESEAHKICGVFDGHWTLLEELELATDVETFFKKGAGHPGAYSIACTLLEDFFSSSRAVANSTGGDGHPFGHFRFAHAETLMPFLALLGIYDKGPFPARKLLNFGSDAAALSGKVWTGTGDFITPMGASVAWLLYDCGDAADAANSGSHDSRWKVKLLHNELVRRFPACPESDLCSLSDLETYYRGSVYSSLGVGSCSHEDWAASCNGVEICGGKDAPSLVD